MGLAALPASGFFGLFLAPLLLPGAIWLMVLGARLVGGSPAATGLARRTAFVTAPLAVLLGAYGVFALNAAARSAAEGGGLLGAFGYLPILLGLLLGALSAFTLVLTRR